MKKLSTTKLYNFLRSITFVLAFLHPRIFEKFKFQYIIFTIRCGPFLGVAENISNPYKCICRGGSFWEPFVGAILNWAAPKKKGGIATYAFCSSGMTRPLSKCNDNFYEQYCWVVWIIYQMLINCLIWPTGVCLPSFFASKCVLMSSRDKTLCWFSQPAESNIAK